MSSNHVITDVYFDFDGVICQLGGLPLSFHRQHDLSLVMEIDNHYPVDNETILNIRWSSQMVDELRQLLDSGAICWHWLTSNQGIIDLINQRLGLPDTTIITERLFQPDGRIVPGGKPGIIQRHLERFSRDRQRHRVAWIDDDYPQDDPEVRLLMQTAAELKVPLLVIAPDARYGLSRSEVASLRHFAEMD